MKKLLVLIVCMVLLGSAVAEEPLINVGDYNENVIALHQKMSDLGLYGLRSESPWGPASVEGLSLLQGLLGLEETGNVENAAELEKLLKAEIDTNINLATGTDEPFMVAPRGQNSWCSPYELFPTSAMGLTFLKNVKHFTVSFDWEATGVDTAVDASISLRYTGPDKTWYAPVGRFAVPIGDNSGHCEVVFDPNPAMREHGTGWLIGEVGADVNREMKVTISNFEFKRVIE